MWSAYTSTGISAPTLAMQALLAWLPRSPAPTGSLRSLPFQRRQALIANAELGIACATSGGCRAAGHQWSGLATADQASCCNEPDAMAGCAQLAPLTMVAAA